ncbi:MAG: DMT family transporter [Desulfocapsaceae bacterium]|nr:DMT family transporter [Desulfocapsaceae bacterium]
MKKKGLYSAIISAILFGLSPVACKAIVGQMPSSLLAGLLYLGSGLGLTGVVLRQKLPVYDILKSLSRRQQVNLTGAILSGGVAAPLFLAYSIRSGTATEVSLLLNFETVATTLLAWMIFHEHIGYRVWIGKFFIIGASILVLFTGSEGVRLSISGLSVLAACFLWGIDNNLTRELETIPASLLACVKGWTAGTFNVILFIVLFRSPVTTFQVSGTLVIGALSYGVSLVLFIHALREIGAARTSTWFASGPFVGTILSVIVLGERPPGAYWIAAPLMFLGMFLLYWEVHQHYHQHERLAHSHLHEHDEHHPHEHDEEGESRKHDHAHIHKPTDHTHVHWPDIHHRHIH